MIYRLPRKIVVALFLSPFSRMFWKNSWKIPQQSFEWFSENLFYPFFPESFTNWLDQPKYSERQLLTFSHIMDFSFSQFSFFFQNDLERNDTLFESPKIELLESTLKLGVAWPWAWPHPLKWKSTLSTKTRLEPFMTKIRPVSKLLSNNG